MKKVILFLILFLALAGGLVSAGTTFAGTTLNVSMSLGENEWKVMREQVFPLLSNLEMRFIET